MRHAFEQALQVEDVKHRHGAALYLGDKLLAVAHNARLRHSGRPKIDTTKCAERRLLKKIPKGLNPEDLTMVVVRLNPAGEPRLSRPCSVCEAAIQRVGIGLVLFSTEETRLW